MVSKPSSKNLELTFSALTEPLLFHCGDSSTASAIIAKLESSKAAAGEALQMAAAESRTGAADSGEEHDDDDETAAAGAPPKAVRWASSPTSPVTTASTASVLYDFDAQGEDELSVRENETVSIVDRENDEWWTVRNASGEEGVVPAQYVQVRDAHAMAAANVDDDGDEGRHAEDEAAAAAAVQSDRQRERERKAEERRAIEKASRDKQRQEEEDRQYAQEVEEKEKAKRERRERRRQEEARESREAEAEKRSARADSYQSMLTEFLDEKLREVWSRQKLASGHRLRTSQQPLQTYRAAGAEQLRNGLPRTIGPVSIPECVMLSIDKSRRAECRSYEAMER